MSLVQVHFHFHFHFHWKANEEKVDILWKFLTASQIEDDDGQLRSKNPLGLVDSMVHTIVVVWYNLITDAIWFSLKISGINY